MNRIHCHQCVFLIHVRVVCHIVFIKKIIFCRTTISPLSSINCLYQTMDSMPNWSTILPLLFAEWDILGRTLDPAGSSLPILGRECTSIKMRFPTIPDEPLFIKLRHQKFSRVIEVFPQLLKNPTYSRAARKLTISPWRAQKGLFFVVGDFWPAESRLIIVVSFFILSDYYTWIL